MVVNLALFFMAAFFEIFGCFAFWMALRLEKSAWWMGVGVLSLVLFAYVLTRVEVDFAGRTYAIYGGIYIAASLLWLVGVEKESFSRWDVVGAAVSIAGALIILVGNMQGKLEG